MKTMNLIAGIVMETRRRLSDNLVCHQGMKVSREELGLKVLTVFLPFTTAIIRVDTALE